MSEKHDANATGRYLADVRADLQRMRSSPPPAKSPTFDIAQSLAENVYARIGNDPMALKQFSIALAKLINNPNE